MYSLVVRGKEDIAAAKGAATSAGEQASPPPSGAASPRAAGKDLQEVDQVAVSAGNPRVEHVTGVVHLYRHIPADAAQPSGEAAPSELPAGRGHHVCVLALPPDMGFPEFSAFLGAYFASAREVRLVRRAGGTSACLVLLRFNAQDAADGFYKDFNGKPVRGACANSLPF
jgi:BRCA1-associated protein